VIWYVWILVNYLADRVTEPEYSSLYGSINLGIHEAGHLVFGCLGSFMGAFGGTLLQCIAPVAGGAVLGRQRDYFGVAVCVGWLSTNLFHTAGYMADARAMKLPLVTVGESGGIAYHDWNWMLTRLGLIEHDYGLAVMVKTAGAAAMTVSLAMMAWLLWQMFRQPKSAPPLDLRGPAGL